MHLNRAPFTGKLDGISEQVSKHRPHLILVCMHRSSLLDSASHHYFFFPQGHFIEKSYLPHQLPRGEGLLQEAAAGGEQLLELVGEHFELREAFGDHIFEHFINNKKREWEEYICEIHAWELERYVDRY